MSSAFLVFDLIGRNAGPERQGNARCFVHPEFDDREEAIGFVVSENGHPSSGGQSFADVGPAPNSQVPSVKLVAATFRDLPVYIKSAFRLFTYLHLSLGAAG